MILKSHNKSKFNLTRIPSSLDEDETNKILLLGKEQNMKCRSYAVAIYLYQILQLYTIIFASKDILKYLYRKLSFNMKRQLFFSIIGRQGLS